jgi:hypothetical protein
MGRKRPEYRFRIEQFDRRKVTPETYFLVSRSSHISMPELYPASKPESDYCECEKRCKDGGPSGLRVFYNSPDFIHIRAEDGVVVLGIPRGELGRDLRNALVALVRKK